MSLPLMNVFHFQTLLQYYTIRFSLICLQTNNFTQTFVIYYNIVEGWNGQMYGNTIANNNVR